MVYFEENNSVFMYNVISTKLSLEENNIQSEMMPSTWSKYHPCVNFCPRVTSLYNEGVINLFQLP